MTLNPHPLCRIFPSLVEGDFNALCTDIKEHGLHEPITIYNDEILDGANRYRACLEVGVAPMFTPFKGADALAFVLTKNLHRRQLTPGQRAVLVSSATNLAAARGHGGDRRSDQVEALPLETQLGRAKAAGTSVKTQGEADRLVKTCPDIAEKVIQGSMSLPEAVKQSTPKRSNSGSGRLSKKAQRANKKSDARTAKLELEVARLQRTHREIVLRAEKAEAELAELRRPADERLVEAESEISRLREQIDQLRQHLAGKDDDRNECVRKCKGYKLRIEELEKQLAGSAA